MHSCFIDGPQAPVDSYFECTTSGGWKHEAIAYEVGCRRLVAQTGGGLPLLFRRRDGGLCLVTDGGLVFAVPAGRQGWSKPIPDWAAVEAVRRTLKAAQRAGQRWCPVEVGSLGRRGSTLLCMLTATRVDPCPTVKVLPFCQSKDAWDVLRGFGTLGQRPVVEWPGGGAGVDLSAESGLETILIWIGDSGPLQVPPAMAEATRLRYQATPWCLATERPEALPDVEPFKTSREPLDAMGGHLVVEVSDDEEVFQWFRSTADATTSVLRRGLTSGGKISYEESDVSCESADGTVWTTVSVSAAHRWNEVWGDLRGSSAPAGPKRPL